MAANWDVKHHDFQTENFHGVLKGHSGWVTQVVTHPQFPDRLVSSSRDKSLIVWRLQQEMGFGTEDPESNILGTPVKSLRGHSHIVSDVTLSADGNYALSGSWDKTLRLWDLKQAQSTRTFHGHTNSVLSVTISPDNRLIGSGSRDKTIKLWNTLGECKYTKGPGEEGAHDDWVSCVRFSPNTNALMLVSAGWDHKIKVWNMQGMFQFAASGKGPNGHINAITISPDGSLCGSGGKDGNPDLWDLNECKELQTLGYDPKDEFAKRQDKEPINALTFSPTRYWLATAVGSGIKIWELEHKQLQYEISIKDGAHEGKSNKALDVVCLSLAWSSDGNRLYAGFSDNTIRVWNVPGAPSGHDIF